MFRHLFCPFLTRRGENLRAVLFAVLFCWGSLQAAEWQWSVPVSTALSPDTGDHPRAFLWIPPHCQQLRGVVVGQHNMEEEPILEHPKFRAELSRLGFAEVWVSPGFDLFFQFDRGAGDHFTAMMKALAQESGYQELEFVPVVPIGHSAAASFPWNFGAWNPARTLAVISVSGQWPFYSDPTMPKMKENALDGVPGLVTMGEYESAESRAGEGLKQRARHPLLPLTMLAEPGAGHFDVSDAKVEFLCLYLRKAAHYRLPAQVPLDRPAELKPVDPTRQGWLVSRWRRDQKPLRAARPAGGTPAESKDAFWCFDEELAKAIETLGDDQRGKKPQLVSYLQDGKIVEQSPKLHAQVDLPFRPLGDGRSFTLHGAFLETVPPGRPEKWSAQPAGSSITHASTGGAVALSRICGPVEQLNDHTFAIRFDRVGTKNTKRSNEIWLLATHHGDATYRRAVQQAVLHIPLSHTKGQPQRLTFPPIADRPAGAGSVKLAPSSDAGAPVQCYVLAGPAEIEGDTLKFTELPPRAKYPVKVTVVACQWGRSVEPLLQTAEPVERAFFLTLPSRAEK